MVCDRLLSITFKYGLPNRLCAENDPEPVAGPDAQTAGFFAAAQQYGSLDPDHVCGFLQTAHRIGGLMELSHFLTKYYFCILVIP
jgi:hypothetical protein